MHDGQIHFISGLPRSGSTLLSAILKQNSRFRSKVTSPMLSMINAVMPTMSGGEFSSFFDDARRAAVYRGLFGAYYGQTSGQVVFDTNRLWTGKLAMLKSLYPTAKTICCVRHPSWILDSFERAFRRNPLRGNVATGYEPQPSMHARLEGLVRSETGTVGLAWNALRDAWHSDQADGLIIVDYDRLIDQPDAVVAGLYDALGEAAHPHDFTALAHDEPDYDEATGMPGLHTVRAKLERIERPPCLPPELFQKYETDLFWRTRSDAGGRRAVVL